MIVSVSYLLGMNTNTRQVAAKKKKSKDVRGYASSNDSGSLDHALAKVLGCNRQVVSHVVSRRNRDLETQRLVVLWMEKKVWEMHLGRVSIVPLFFRLGWFRVSPQ